MRVTCLAVVVMACGAPPPRRQVVAPAIRLWAVRDQVLKVPPALTFERQSTCLSEGNPAFGGQFTGGPARVVTLRAADRRIEAVFSCDADSPLEWLWVYPASAPDVRYVISFTEAGVSIDLRTAGAWQRICDEDHCRVGLSRPELAFWDEQWKALGDVQNVSELAVALDAAVSAMRRP